MTTAWSPRRARAGRGLWLGIAGASVAAVAAALVAQYAFDMQPCPWCILQRLIYLLIAVACVIAALTPRPLRLAFGAIAIALAASGVGAAAYQHVVAARQSSCSFTLADTLITALHLESRVPFLFQVTATCADAAVSVLGLPFEYWSLGMFVLLGLAAASALRQR